MSTDPTFTVGGIPFGDTDAFGVKWNLKSEAGWYGGAGVRSDVAPRPFAHGEFDATRYRSGRQVTFGGTTNGLTRSLAVNAQQRFAAVLGDGTPSTLTVVDALGTLTATVALDDAPQFGWVTDTIFDWQLTVRAPDPRKYGPQTSVVCGMPSTGGGLVFPLFIVSGIITWGTVPAPQVDIVTNNGTAAAPVVFTVAGGASGILGGFQITEQITGNILRYVDDLPAGSSVVLDGATGNVTLNGTADRRGSLSIAQWTQIPPATTRNFVLGGLSGFSATATLTAVSRPAYW